MTQNAAPKTASVMEIQEFVRADQVDPIFLESSYYMAPDKGGEKPYALLFEALRQAQYYGIAKVSMHNREHVVILRPAKRGILLHTMYYVDEIRQVDEFRTDTSMVKEKELELAKTLIDTLAADFEPQKYHDTYRDNLQKLIEAKIEGRKVVETPEPKVAPVIDIMEALRKSLAEQRKPVASATTSAAEEAPKKRARRKAS
jgi:DNA end-binding protein Ku